MYVDAFANVSPGIVAVGKVKGTSSENVVQISKDGVFAGDKKGQSGRAEFSDGSYLEYINGILIGGRTADGTEF